MKNQRYIILSFLGAAVLLGMSVQGLVVPFLARQDIGGPSTWLGLVNATAVAGSFAGVDLLHPHAQPRRTASRMR